MTSVGVVFRPQWAPERLAALARVADQAGLAELWFWEDCFFAGGIASATAALATTSRLRVGVGVLPVPLRNVALAAMELATLSRLFPGRFQPGFGHGVLDWMGQVGQRVDSPMTLLEEYLSAIRALLDGQRVSAEGRYVHLDDVALEWPPQAAAPLYAAAVGPRTLALSGRLAEGTVLTGGGTPAEVRRARCILDEARAEAGRPGRHLITVYLMATTGPDAVDRLAAERRNWKLDPGQDNGVAGDAATVAGAVRRWVEAGADSVILQPAVDDPDIEGFIRFAAHEVQPLLA